MARHEAQVIDTALIYSIPGSLDIVDIKYEVRFSHCRKHFGGIQRGATLFRVEPHVIGFHVRQNCILLTVLTFWWSRGCVS